jgi:hypothetical protein
MTTTIRACPVKREGDRPVKWLRQKVISGYPDWKCLPCDKVADENHLQTPNHKKKLAYWFVRPDWYPDSEDDMYKELYKQEEEEDQRAIAAGQEAAWAAHAAAEPEPTPSAWMEGAPGAHAAAEPEPTSSSGAAWMEGARAATAAPKAAPPPLSQAASSSAAGSTSSSASTWIGGAHEAGSAPTAAQTAVPDMLANLRLILENSKKIQKLVRAVNELSAQNAELASLVLRESNVS